MTQLKKGLILPDTKDLLTYYLIQAKEEATYVSNEDIAGILTHCLDEDELTDIINRIQDDLATRND